MSTFFFHESMSVGIIRGSGVWFFIAKKEKERVSPFRKIP